MTRVTLWGITVGNEMENRERFEIVTKDFLSSNVPKNITIPVYTQESFGTRILETQVIKRDDLSVTILKVEIVGQATAVLMMMGIVMTAMTALQLSTRLLMSQIMTSVMKMSMPLRMLF